MYFSEVFHVNKTLIKKYGAIDISLTCDLPLFIDPLLIFNSRKTEYKKLHKELIKFFAFLTQKSDQGVDKDTLNSYFLFPEIKNNWLGYAKHGNGGRGLGKEFGSFLSQNLKFIMTNHGITKSCHIEKALLIYEGNGKDKISDLTANLILDFLASYTQEFALSYIKPKYLKTFFLQSKFNYKTQTFQDVEYKLPYILNEKGIEEYVLLTPMDILREEDPAISHNNLRKVYDQVRTGISNESHRAQLNQYIGKAVSEYLIEQEKRKKKVNEQAIRKVEKKAFFEALKDKDFDWLYDYYIKLVENEANDIVILAHKECNRQITMFYGHSDELKKLFTNNPRELEESTSAREELIHKINYMKDTIENREGYKLLYNDGKCITSEDDLQRLFRFTLDGTEYDFNFDGNNGMGEYDIKAANGAKDVCLAELKLASNPRLTHVFDQTEVYEKANHAKTSVYVIFYFTLEEEQKVVTLLETNENFKDHREDIILIDCRKDNKVSASRR